MKLEFDRSLDLPVPAARTWAFLDRIDKVAACMPGAAITEEIDPTHYRGTVSVRLGPVNMVFQGTIEIVSRDPPSRTIAIAGKGSDKSGTSVAELALTASVAETGPESSRITGKSVVTVAGKAAAMGARLMNSVSEQLIKEFFANLVKGLEAEPVPVAATVAPEAAAEAPPPRVNRPARSLNGLAFLWSVLKSFFADLWSGKRTSP